MALIYVATCTLAEAFARHPADLAYLACVQDQWEGDMPVRHYTDGTNDEYLGDDTETVFAVYGQAEPLLTADAAYWQMRHAALEHKT